MGHGTSTLARTFSEDIGQVPPPPFFLFAFFFVFISSKPSSSSSVRISTNSLLPSKHIIIIEQFFGVHPRRTANRGGTANAREARSEEEEEEEDSGPLSKEGVLSAKIIGALPLEKVEGKSALLKRWSVKELAREVKANHASKCPHSKAKFKGPPPLEKEELVEVVLSLRGDPMCSVCFEQFVEDEYVRVLPCGHRYHIECVDRWLASKSIRCPMCQHPADER